jgi:hypothetical protein
MTIDTYEIPLLVGFILQIGMAGVGFGMGLLIKKMTSRRATIWVSTIAAFMAGVIGYGLLFQSFGEFDRSGTIVVYADEITNGVQQVFIGLMVALISYAGLRHTLPVPVLAFLLHFCLSIGHLKGGFYYWFCWICSLVFFALLALAMFAPDMKLAGGPEALPEKNKNKRLVFRLLYLLFQAAYIVMFIFDPAATDIIPRLGMNIAYLVISALAGVFVFLVYFAFKPEDDLADGVAISGPTEEAADAAAGADESETASISSPLTGGSNKKVQQRRNAGMAEPGEFSAV